MAAEEEPSPEEFGREVYAKAVKEIRDSAPKVGISAIVAVLIWLIANYIFIPISTGYFIREYAVTQLISLIILAALAVIFFGIVRELKDLADSAAGIVAYEVGSRRAEVSTEELSNYRTAFRGILFVFIAAVGFLLFAEQLRLLHPALSAIVLLAVVAWSVFSIYRSGRALSKTVEIYASE